MSQLIKERIFRQLTSRVDPIIVGVVSVDNCEDTGGRGLFLRKSVKKGDIIFEEFPLWPTVIGFFRFQQGYCFNCMRRLGSDSIKCPGDGCDAKYCNTDCLKMSADLSHRALCVSSNEPYKRYLQIAIDSDNEYYVVAARLLWMFPSAPWKYHYHSPIWTDKTPDEHHMSLTDEIDMMARLLRLALHESGSEDGDLITPEALGRTIGMLRVNVLGLRHDDQDLGFAMYPTQSLINHSDTPNCRCVTVFGLDNPNSPCLCGIEALQDIGRGEQLFIDYIGNVSKEIRENTLLMQYGIDSPPESIHD